VGLPVQAWSGGEIRSPWPGGAAPIVRMQRAPRCRSLRHPRRGFGCRQSGWEGLSFGARDRTPRPGIRTNNATRRYYCKRRAMFVATPPMLCRPSPRRGPPCMLLRPLGARAHLPGVGQTLFACRSAVIPLSPLRAIVADGRLLYLEQSCPSLATSRDSGAEALWRGFGPILMPPQPRGDGTRTPRVFHRGARPPTRGGNVEARRTRAGQGSPLGRAGSG